MSDKKQQTQKKNNQGDSGNTKRGFLYYAILGVTKCGSWLFVSLLTSIAVSMIGLTFFWAEQGSAHEANTLKVESGLLAQQLQENKIVLRLLKDSEDTFVWDLPHYVGKTVGTVGKIFTNRAEEYADSASYAVRIFIIRLLIIATTAWVLFVSLMGATITGLVERDLRRVNLARESSTRFHLVLSHLESPMFFLIVMYLSWPTTTNPLYFVIPAYAVMAFLLYVSIAFYKKYT
jgi:hypothetical protein